MLHASRGTNPRLILSKPLRCVSNQLGATATGLCFTTLLKLLRKHNLVKQWLRACASSYSLPYDLVLTAMSISLFQIHCTGHMCRRLHASTQCYTRSDNHKHHNNPNHPTRVRPNCTANLVTHFLADVAKTSHMWRPHPSRHCVAPQAAADKQAAQSALNVQLWDVVQYSTAQGTPSACLGVVQEMAGDVLQIAQLHEESPGVWLIHDHSGATEAVQLNQVQCVIEADYTQRVDPDRISNPHGNARMLFGGNGCGYQRTQIAYGKYIP